MNALPMLWACRRHQLGAGMGLDAVEVEIRRVLNAAGLIGQREEWSWVSRETLTEERETRPHYELGPVEYGEGP